MTPAHAAPERNIKSAVENRLKTPENFREFFINNLEVGLPYL
jgi:hypothetical protein